MLIHNLFFQELKDKLLTKNKEELFSGVAIRTFAYQFQLVPRSPKEVKLNKFLELSNNVCLHQKVRKEFS